MSTTAGTCSFGTEKMKNGQLGGIHDLSEHKNDRARITLPIHNLLRRRGRADHRTATTQRLPLANGCRYVQKMVRRTAFRTRSSAQSAHLDSLNHSMCARDRASGKNDRPSTTPCEKGDAVRGSRR